MNNFHLRKAVRVNTSNAYGRNTSNNLFISNDDIESGYRPVLITRRGDATPHVVIVDTKYSNAEILTKFDNNELPYAKTQNVIGVKVDGYYVITTKRNVTLIDMRKRWYDPRMPIGKTRGNLSALYYKPTHRHVTWIPPCAGSSVTLLHNDCATWIATSHERHVIGTRINTEHKNTKLTIWDAYLVAGDISAIPEGYRSVKHLSSLNYAPMGNYGIVNENTLVWVGKCVDFPVKVISSDDGNLLINVNRRDQLVRDCQYDGSRPLSVIGFVSYDGSRGCCRDVRSQLLTSPAISSKWGR